MVTLTTRRIQNLCQALELDNLTEEDPGVQDDLDKLASEYADWNFSERDVQRSKLVSEARKAVTVSLGHL
jgi:hypothetical protein